VKVHPLAKKANPRPPRRPCRELIPVFCSIATHAPVPKDLLRQLVQEWSSRTTTVVWAVVAEDNAEAIRRELMADCRWTACNLLLNRAVELLPLVSVVPDLAEPLP